MKSIASEMSGERRCFMLLSVVVSQQQNIYTLRPDSRADGQTLQAAGVLLLDQFDGVFCACCLLCTTTHKYRPPTSIHAAADCQAVGLRPACSRGTRALQNVNF